MDLRTEIWNARFRAKWLARYYCECANKSARKATFVETAAALTSAASVLTWLTEHASKLVPILALAGAVLSALPMLTKYSRDAAECQSAFRHWLRRERAWDQLWLTEENLTSDDYARARLEDDDFDHPQGDNDNDLALATHNQITRSLGLA